MLWREIPVQRRSVRAVGLDRVVNATGHPVYELADDLTNLFENEPALMQMFLRECLRSKLRLCEIVYFLLEQSVEKLDISPNEPCYQEVPFLPVPMPTEEQILLACRDALRNDSTLHFLQRHIVTYADFKETAERGIRLLRWGFDPFGLW